MRTASMVLGIIGGVFGIIAGFLALLLGGIGAAFDADDSSLVVGLGFGAVLIGVVGIVGGALAPPFFRLPRRVSCSLTMTAKNEPVKSCGCLYSVEFREKLSDKSNLAQSRILRVCKTRKRSPDVAVLCYQSVRSRNTLAIYQTVSEKLSEKG